MKQLLLVTLFVLPCLVNADESLQMSNGMTCFRNPSGYTYGCSGGASTGDSGYNDVRTGERYESTSQGQAVNTRSGQFVDTPRRNNDENYDKYNDADR